jgi:hypothetical protein
MRLRSCGGYPVISVPGTSRGAALGIRMQPTMDRLPAAIRAPTERYPKRSALARAAEVMSLSYVDVGEAICALRSTAGSEPTECASLSAMIPMN